MRFCPLLVAFGLLVQTGCSRSISKEQAERVRIGMNVAEVERILGDGKALERGDVEALMRDALAAAPAPEVVGKLQTPTIAADPSDFKAMRWGDDKKSVTVLFRQDRAFRIKLQGLD